MAVVHLAQREPDVTTQRINRSQELALYDAMVSAIAACAQVDEIKEIRDKAVALEAYYRQARNFEAEREAANVRLRAERRAGELLKDLARATPVEAGAQGGRGHEKSTSAPETSFSSPYAAALEANGITRQTAHRFQALANVPAAIFEDALSGPEKPTAARVAARAKVRQAVDPEPVVSTEALWLWGRLRDFENKNYLTATPGKLFAGMTEAMKRDVMRLAPRVADFLRRMEVSNEPA